jgi:hypothetical protein
MHHSLSLSLNGLNKPDGHFGPTPCPGEKVMWSFAFCTDLIRLQSQSVFRNLRPSFSARCFLWSRAVVHEKFGKRATQEGGGKADPCALFRFFRVMTDLRPVLFSALPGTTATTSPPLRTRLQLCHCPRPIPFLLSLARSFVVRSFFARRAADLSLPYFGAFSLCHSRGTSRL